MDAAETATWQPGRDSVYTWIPILSYPRPSLDSKPLADIRQRARAELDRILTEHQREPLGEAAQAELQVILDAATRELVG
jgi:hypothetical protein